VVNFTNRIPKSSHKSSDQFIIMQRAMILRHEVPPPASLTEFAGSVPCRVSSGASHGNPT
jgi:hypothetical protein